MGLPEILYISEKEYLDAERLALDKHEYYKGEVFDMSGASILRIHIPKNTLFTYPDISIICGEIETTDDKFDTITNPSVIIEILSSSTRNYDKGEKIHFIQRNRFSAGIHLD